VHRLRRVLESIDGRGYKAYSEMKGRYDFDFFELVIARVQRDPFAPPTPVRVRVKQSFPEDTYSNRSREVALRDFLTRRFHEAARRHSRHRGSGNSGAIEIDRPGQEVLERNSVVVSRDWVEARIFMGLPAHGRRVSGRDAVEMFTRDLPAAVRESLIFESLDREQLYRHVRVCEDADAVRAGLTGMGLVAFVADGSVLPRRSGVDDRPLEEGAVRFRAPPSLAVEVETPNSGRIRGMGIPEGVTLVVGGGYHGKSTLLRAVECGIYNHIPGDGRELVVTVPGAVKVRAEDGRRIEKVDISSFIGDLPFGTDTASFSTDNASGSTSQAANIIEAMEAGASCIMLDEDTSATNFMIRDRRMQELVSKDNEPITPFVDRVREMYERHGVSSIIVLGGSGDYFDVADCVICMVNYLPVDMTERAKEIAEKFRTGRMHEAPSAFSAIRKRAPLPESIDPSRGKRDVKISVKGKNTVLFGTYTVDLWALEQIVHISQTRAVASAMHYAVRYMDGRRPMREVAELVLRDITDKGLDVLSGAGNLACFRGIELCAALNRLRSLRVRQVS